jgi:hypothetical protein
MSLAKWGESRPIRLELLLVHSLPSGIERPRNRLYAILQVNPTVMKGHVYADSQERRNEKYDVALLHDRSERHNFATFKVAPRLP